MRVVVGCPTADAAVVAQAAHVSVVVTDRLHEAPAVEPENDLRLQHLVSSAKGDPLHGPVRDGGDGL
jgi:hypothetical protein